VSRPSPLELEILRAICEGRTTQEIAATLGISERAVDRHIANTLRELDAASRAEAVFKAFRAGLLDDAPALMASAITPRAAPTAPAPSTHPLIARSRGAMALAARWAVAAVIVLGVILAATEMSTAPLFRIGPLPLPATPTAAPAR
jgi:DNA-binding CsgD family transcriptional regulator